MADNIEDNTQIESAPTSLYKLFDELAYSIECARDMADSLSAQEHDQARVDALIKFCKHVCVQQEKIYELLAEMNDSWILKLKNHTIL